MKRIKKKKRKRNRKQNKASKHNLDTRTMQNAFNKASARESHLLLLLL